MTAEELTELVSRLRAAPLLPAGAGQPVADGVGTLLAALPHRAPMLLLDVIDAIDPVARRLRARRRLDPADPIFAGHFPGGPIYPGVLLIEMIGQAGLCLLPQDASSPRQLVRVHQALFRAPARPGDELEVHATVADEGLTTVLAGQVFASEQLCALAILDVY